MDPMMVNPRLVSLMPLFFLPLLAARQEERNKERAIREASGASETPRQSEEPAPYLSNDATAEIERQRQKAEQRKAKR